MLYDTGSQVSIMDSERCNVLNEDWDEAINNLKIVSVTGHVQTLTKVKTCRVNTDKGVELGDISFWLMSLEDKGYDGILGIKEIRRLNIPLPPVWEECNVMSAATEDWQLVDIGQVNGKHQQLVRDILQQRSDMFVENVAALKAAKVPPIKIDVDINDVTFRRQYPIPYSLLEPYKVLLDKFFESGIIKRSRSDWNSPVHLVKKPDGSLRFVLDLRQVNDKLRNQDYPMIRIDTAMAAVGGAKYFSTLDLASGYYQLKLDSNVTKCFAFQTPFGKFEMSRLPQGCKISSNVFQREMHRILSGLLGKNCQCFIDDVLIYSESLEQHLADLTEVLDRLRKYGLQVRPSKCQLFQEEVTFLGHRVDKDGIHPKENNIEKIKNMSPPKTVSGVRRFLGAVGFYRKFIAGFSEIAAPLYELTKKGTRYEWNEAAQRAYDKLKTCLSSAPILIHPYYREKFLIFTDASDIGCGGMLSQLKNGTPQPISFYSHKFRGAELNYSTIEKECLAIIMAIEQFDYYIYGQQVEIYCDHKPLQYLKSLENKNRRLMKWALMLQDRELTFFHVKGKENAMADWLSRDTYNTEVAVVDVYGGVNTIPNYEKSMLNCPVWKNIYKRALSTDSEVEEGDGTYFISKSTRYLVKVSPDSRPTRKGRMVKQIVIPPVLRDTILERCHDSPIGGHLSVEKTLYAVLSHYYWKGAMSDVRRYVKTCPVCAENNGRLKKAPNMPIQPANYPFERLCVDFVGPLTLSRNRNRYLLVFIDAFTRYAEVIPVRDCTAETAGLEFVNKIVNRYGTCKEILSDRGAAFESDLFREICKLYSIKKLSTTSYRPTCNSIVERVNGTICSILRHYANSRNWEDNLGAAVAAYNNAVHSALGESPHYMLFGYDAVNHEVSDKDVSEFRKPSLAERLKEMQDARETVRKFPCLKTMMNESRSIKRRL
ncbi:K02A2.6-like [Cordylochernes scorpioides]|uniref:RNA-directed DNA polymerase n=1 Tax=Cordylochernes scorpioides TaxID=51811 RepID=A0ABY6KZE4_9ARAC|nr:K02A2.6-like [Cordylochernes scorpioides]